MLFLTLRVGLTNCYYVTMKTTVAMLLCSISVLTAWTASTVAKYLVLKVRDRADYESYTVVTPEGLKALQDEIRKELRFHGRALSLARKYWRENENNRRTFPASAIGKRSFSVVGSTFAHEENALERAAQLQLRMQTKRDLESQKDKDRQKRRYKDSTRRKARTFSDKAREREKNYIDNRAREIYEEQLNLLMKPAEEAKKAQ